jgi:hypothetical protein
MQQRKVLPGIVILEVQQKGNVQQGEKLNDDLEAEQDEEKDPVRPWGDLGGV